MDPHRITASKPNDEWRKIAARTSQRISELEVAVDSPEDVGYGSGERGIRDRHTYGGTFSSSHPWKITINGDSTINIQRGTVYWWWHDINEDPEYGHTIGYDTAWVYEGGTSVELPAGSGSELGVFLVFDRSSGAPGGPDQFDAEVVVSESPPEANWHTYVIRLGTVWLLGSTLSASQLVSDDVYLREDPAPGTIMMWAGAVEDIPGGWALFYPASSTYHDALYLQTIKHTETAGYRDRDTCNDEGETTNDDAYGVHLIEKL